MNQFFFAIYFVIALIFSGIDLFASGTENQDQLFSDFPLSTKLVLPLSKQDADRFELIYKDATPDGKMYIHEWIPIGQNLDNWHEMITISFQKDLPKNTSRLKKLLKSTYADRYFGSINTVETLKEDENELIVLLKVPFGHKNIPPFSTILRFIVTPDGVQSIWYEKRFKNIDNSDQKKWIETLQNAYLIKKSNNKFAKKLNDEFKKSLRENDTRNICDEFNKILKTDLKINDKLIVNLLEDDFKDYKLNGTELDMEEGFLLQTWIPKNQSNSSKNEEVRISFLKRHDRFNLPTAVESAEILVQEYKSKYNPSELIVKTFPRDLDDVVIHFGFLENQKNERPKQMIIRFIHTSYGKYTITYIRNRSFRVINNDKATKDVLKWTSIVWNTTLASKDNFPKDIENDLQICLKNTLSNQKGDWIELKKLPLRNEYYMKEWIPNTQSPDLIKDSIAIICNKSIDQPTLSVEELCEIAKDYAVVHSKGKIHTFNILEKGDSYLVYEIFAPLGALGEGLKYTLRYELITSDNRHWMISVGKDIKMNDKDRQFWIKRFHNAEIANLNL